MAATMVSPEQANERKVIQELLDTCYLAQREFPRVGNDEFPTPWDMRHRKLNDMLTLLEANR